jgi:hypothetical protein
MPYQVWRIGTELKPRPSQVSEAIYKSIKIEGGIIHLR